MTPRFRSSRGSLAALALLGAVAATRRVADRRSVRAAPGSPATPEPATAPEESETEAAGPAIGPTIATLPQRLAADSGSTPFLPVKLATSFVLAVLLATVAPTSVPAAGAATVAGPTRVVVTAAALELARGLPLGSEATPAPASEPAPAPEPAPEPAATAPPPSPEPAPAPAPRPGPAAAFTTWPVAGSITGQFGENRRSHRHAGIDIDANTGDAVVAAAPGVVTIAGRAGSGYSGYGIIVVIDHGGGLTTMSAHLSRVDVRPGDVVEAGQLIGAVGSTGASTGSHLHYEVRQDDVPQNPLAYLP